MYIKNVIFFVFVCLYTFYAFCTCEILSQKKKIIIIKRPKISLDNLNLHTTDVYFSQPTPGELFARQYFSIIIIFFHYHNTIQ